MSIIKAIVDKVLGTAGKVEGSLRDKLQAHYVELCAKRDATNADIAPLRAQVDTLNAEIVIRQDQVRVLVQQLNDKRGGADWLQLKTEIGVVASALNKLK